MLYGLQTYAFRGVKQCFAGHKSMKKTSHRGTFSSDGMSLYCNRDVIMVQQGYFTERNETAKPPARAMRNFKTVFEVTVLRVMV